MGTKLSISMRILRQLVTIKVPSLQSGASQLVAKDLKEEFVRDYIFPCLRAGAIYERKYLLGTSMARPIIAKQGFPFKYLHNRGIDMEIEKIERNQNPAAAEQRPAAKPQDPFSSQPPVLDISSRAGLGTSQ
ncbi:argininosuccinate synthase [Sarracenia purpurea var. burkii]